MKITALHSTIVCPKVLPSPHKMLWVSNLDLLVPTQHVTSLHFYKPTEVVDVESLGETLQESLSRVLVDYAPLAGRWEKDASGRPGVICNGSGALFVKAVADLSIEDLGGFVPGPELLQLVPRIDYSQDISKWPLLVVQVTMFRCGCMSIGVGLQHMLADGMAGFSFIRAWSEVTRGLEELHLQPVLDRTLLKARSPPTPMFPHAEYNQPSKSNNQISVDGLTNSEVSVRVIPFSTQDIQKLKRKAPPGTHYSSYEVVAAHAWICACMARRPHSQQTTTMYVAVDGRSRLRPPVSKDYFGNVIFTAVAMGTTEELTMVEDTVFSRGGESHLESSLRGFHIAVAKIHEALKQMDNEYLRSAIDYLEIQPDLSKLKKTSNTFANPNLSVVSWVRLPLYESDFGWGRPFYVSPAHAPFEGQAYLLPSTRGCGSFSLCISLLAHHMPKFLEFVTTV